MAAQQQETAAEQTVCAVVVTYNRKVMLRTCLQSLLAQERAPDKIILVDNASTDGTRDLLAAEFPQLELLALDKNTGGAGGFHAGMKWAYDRGFDWIWLMDDDVEMLPGALRVMMENRSLGEFIHCRKTLADGPHVWEAVWSATSCLPYTLDKDLSFANGKKWMSISYGNFEGALIHRSVPEKIGFPDARYFIGGDDTMYGFLASFHVRVIYLNEFGIVKRIASTQKRSRLHYYLQIRNRYLNRSYFQSVGIPVSRTQFNFSVLMGLFGSWQEILGDKSQRTRANFKAVWNGLQDGRRAVFGPPPWLR